MEPYPFDSENFISSVMEIFVSSIRFCIRTIAKSISKMYFMTHSLAKVAVRNTIKAKGKDSGTRKNFPGLF